MAVQSAHASVFRAHLDRALQRLNTIDGVLGSVMATRDGSVVASAVDDDVIAQTMAATTAAICGRLAEVTEMLGLGAVNAVLADTSTHSIQFMPVGSAVLAVMAQRNQNVRAIREGMRGVADAFGGHPALAPKPTASP